MTGKIKILKTIQLIINRKTLLIAALTERAGFKPAVRVYTRTTV